MMSAYVGVIDDAYVSSSVRFGSSSTKSFRSLIALMASSWSTSRPSLTHTRTSRRHERALYFPTKRFVSKAWGAHPPLPVWTGHAKDDLSHDIPAQSTHRQSSYDHQRALDVDRSLVGGEQVPKRPSAFLALGRSVRLEPAPGVREHEREPLTSSTVCSRSPTHYCSPLRS